MENSNIEWTDHTFNPWHGCMKVSAGCTNCYAEVQDKRFGPSHWGPGSDRKSMSEKYWIQPFRWDWEAKKSGKMTRVFCASMADVFEGHPQTLPYLQRLFQLILDTPHLTWLLLTKRPENILSLVPEAWRIVFPINVWIGTSVENQEAADQRIPHLLRIPARVRFLSCEPLLGPLDLREYMVFTQTNVSNTEEAEIRGWGYDEWSGGFVGPGYVDSCYDAQSGIHWVIAGGESGPKARPMHPDWARSLREQCAEAGASFFFKQWGEYSVDAPENWDKKQVSVSNNGFGYVMHKVGKKVAGRLLDGREWSEFPDGES